MPLEGARTGAPTAIQVADRWYLWHNLAAHAETRARVVRARQRYEQVQALKDEGKNVTEVMRELRLTLGTARRYYRAASADEVVAGTLTGWPANPRSIPNK